MKVEHCARLSAYDIHDRCRRAAQILITEETRQTYPNGFDALNAEPVVPALPVTRASATPHILLTEPFQGEPELRAIAIYIGIGIIEIRDVNGTHNAYGVHAIAGDGFEARTAYLSAALRIYFHDVRFIEASS